MAKRKGRKGKGPAAPKRKTTSGKSRPSRKPIRVWRFGRPVVLIFRRYDGRLLKHRFDKGARILVARDRQGPWADRVVLSGVRVSEFFE